MEIISGAQTGVDQAALLVAMQLGIPYGGWVPKGRTTEAGPLPVSFRNMVETTSGKYLVRTRRNVQDSDATLIICWGDPTGGTLATVNIARECEKPHFVADLYNDPLAHTTEWLDSLPKLNILNVAGPRQSKYKSIDVESVARKFILNLFFMRQVKN